MKDAGGGRRRLAAACQWLVAEAWHAGPEAVNAAIEMVVARIHEIRGDNP
jgi:hypothetical protein